MDSSPLPDVPIKKYAELAGKMDVILPNQLAVSLNAALSSIIECPTCDGTVSDLYTQVVSAKDKVVAAERSIVTGSDDAMACEAWYGFHLLVMQHLGSFSPCRTHPKADKLVLDLSLCCATFRTSIDEYKQRVANIKAYIVRLIVGQDYEEAERVYDQFAIWLEMSLAITFTPGVSFTPLP